MENILYVALNTVSGFWEVSRDEIMGDSPLVFKHLFEVYDYAECSGATIQYTEDLLPF